MSFSSRLKEELSLIDDKPRHCRIAELGAVLCYLGRIDETGRLVVSAENPLPVHVCAVLFSKLYSTDPVVTERCGARRGSTYSFLLSDAEVTDGILKALRLRDGAGKTVEFGRADPAAFTEKQCCKRAFLRGAFLSAGTVSDPERSYSLEILNRTGEQAAHVRDLLQSLGITAKIVKRRGYYVAYIKDSTMISDVIGMMGARNGLLDLENRRILREVRGSVNRKVNCETANIEKTARAAAEQIESIRLIQQKRGLGSLPDDLDEIARLRLEYPMATLYELGQMLEQPIGKSGVNHRFRKIHALAESLKNPGGKEEC